MPTAPPRLHAELAPYADRLIQWSFTGNAGSVRRVLGRAAAVAGRRDDAREHFEAALARHAELRGAGAAGANALRLRRVPPRRHASRPIDGRTAAARRRRAARRLDMTGVAARAAATRAESEECLVLVLTRKPLESIMIGDDIEVRVLAVFGDKVRLGIRAPRESRCTGRRSTSRSRSRTLRAPGRCVPRSTRRSSASATSRDGAACSGTTAWASSGHAHAVRVTLTLSGGASLGAYQAGATAALLVALEHVRDEHDRWVEGDQATHSGV